MVASIFGAVDKVSKTGDTMTGTLTLQGSPPVKVPAAAAGTVLVADGSGNMTPGTITGSIDWIIVAPSGNTSGSVDRTNIQNALNNAQPGQVVYLEAGVFWIDRQLSVPALVLLLGAVGLDVPYVGDHGAVLKLAIGFTGNSAVLISNSGNGSTFAPAGSVSNLAIDGAAITGTAVDGLQGLGNCIRAIVSGLVIGNMSGWGYRAVADTTAPAGQQIPMFWDVKDCLLQACALGGLSLTTQNDTYYNNVYVLGCGNTGNGPGWLITNGAANCRFDNCRSEWSGGYGVYITGVSWNGNGSGGSIWANFSTDRNQWDGIKIDATGAGPITFTNLMLRRDGRNNKTGGGGFSAINCAATTLPVTIGTIHVWPGTDDDGTGTSSPQNGISVAGSTSVTADAGYVQAATTPLNIGTGNGNWWVSPAVVTATGPSTAPANVTGGVVLPNPAPPQTYTGGVVIQDILPGPVIAANGVYPGMIWEFTVWGQVTTTLAAQTVDVQVRYGGLAGTVLLDTGAQQPNAGGAVTNVPFKFKGNVYFQSATEAAAEGLLSQNFFPQTDGQQETVIVSTSAKQLVIGLTPSAAAVSVTVQGGRWRRIS